MIRGATREPAFGARDAWTAPNAAPTRATAQCEMGAPDVLVEIIVTAAVSQ